MMPGGKQNCLAGRLGWSDSRWKQVACRYTTREQHKGCHLILVAFLSYKVKFAFERGIRRTQAKLRAGENLQNCRNTLPKTARKNGGRQRSITTKQTSSYLYTVWVQFYIFTGLNTYQI